MPAHYLMSWIAKTATWMKEYRKKKYAVSCRQLGTPPTKEASYQAANSWWLRKKAELDAAAGPPQPAASPTTDADLLRQLLAGRTVRELEQLASQGDAAARLVSLLEQASTAGLPVEQLPNGAFVGSMPDADAALAQLRNGGTVPDAVLEQLSRHPEDRAIEVRRLAEDIKGPKAAEPARTIAAHADAWHKSQAAAVAAGLLTPDRAANNRTCLAHFRTFLSDAADVATIDAARLQAFYLHCLQMVSARRQGREDGWSVAYAKDVFAVAKTFIRWLWEQDTIDLPKNIGSKAFKFGNGHKRITTWTADEFRLAVAEAPGKLKLALLLMANCGMTQQDISDLADDEVDWQEGRIIRKRSKTKAHEDVPTVNYKLWPTTFALLQQYRSGTERVLLTESGLPFVRKVLKNGKLSKADGFASNWVHVKKRLQRSRPTFNRSLKQLRKLGATLLEGHTDYGRFGTYFLAHSPRTVKDRHYAAPSQALFDAAVLWLGQQLGQC